MPRCRGVAPVSRAVQQRWHTLLVTQGVPMTVLDKQITNLWPAAPQLGISQAVRVGNVVYVAGTPGCHDDFSLPPDMADQMRLAYQTIARILDTVGATLADVVDQTVFVTDIDAAFAVGHVRLEAYGAAGDSLPASAMVEVARLAHPDMKVEIKAIAVLPSLPTA
jgi:2-iminobutanoate/2-iminopropanoate deaminase